MSSDLVFLVLQSQILGLYLVMWLTLPLKRRRKKRRRK